MSKTPKSAGAFAHLGHPSHIPDRPDAATLERAPNPHPDVDYVTRFAAPEFTSICPVTGQPDFAHLVIDYVPDHWLVESKSLKLHLASFRNHGAFHEDCTVRIGKELAGAAQAALAADRRLLVSARRHSDRRVLADRATAEGRLGARPGRRALSRPRLSSGATANGRSRSSSETLRERNAETY